MTTEVPTPINDTDFSPLMMRVLRLAQLEASANRDDRGTAINPEHILIAFIQDGDPRSMAFTLLNNCGFTVADIRNGRLELKSSLAKL